MEFRDALREVNASAELVNPEPAATTTRATRAQLTQSVAAARVQETSAVLVRARCSLAQPVSATLLAVLDSVFHRA